jgi:hypothetical protein
MELLIESFLIFTCLMFWIMFYNKKGLLAEIKKTEKIISEKIIVLEDLLDSANKQSLLANPIDGLKSNISFNANLDVKLDEVTLPLPETTENIENTELRVLSLEDAVNLDFITDEASSALGPRFINLTESAEHDEGEVKLSQGVTDKVLEALDNFNKIDVSEPIQIKTFRDVVLMSKKIEHQ